MPDGEIDSSVVFLFPVSSGAHSFRRAATLPSSDVGTVITDILNPILLVFSEILGGAITTALLILAPILELIAFTLKPLIPIFQVLAMTLQPIVALFDLLAQGIQFILDKIGGGGADASGLSLTPFASGGIVNGPTPALVGEAGPEAIIPLSQLGSMTGGGEFVLRAAGTELIAVINASSENESRIG